MTEETQPETNKAMAPHRLEAFNDVHSSIKSLHADISTALDISSIQRNFEENTNLLKQKETTLLDTVRKIELTKETLVEEVQHREAEELKVNSLISELRAKKSDIETRLTGYEHEVKSIQAEKEKLDSLLKRMKTVLSEMRAKITEFQGILKAE